MSSKARCTGSREFIGLENNREWSRANSCHPHHSEEMNESWGTDTGYHWGTDARYRWGTGVTLSLPLEAHPEILALLRPNKIAKIIEKCNESLMYFGEGMCGKFEVGDHRGK